MTVKVTGIEQDSKEVERRVDGYNTEIETRLSYSIQYEEETPMGNRVFSSVGLPDRFKTKVDDIFKELDEYYQNK